MIFDQNRRAVFFTRLVLFSLLVLSSSQSGMALTQKICGFKGYSSRVVGTQLNGTPLESVWEELYFFGHSDGDHSVQGCNAITFRGESHSSTNAGFVEKLSENDLQKEIQGILNQKVKSRELPADDYVFEHCNSDEYCLDPLINYVDQNYSDQRFVGRYPLVCKPLPQFQEGEYCGSREIGGSGEWISARGRCADGLFCRPTTEHDRDVGGYEFQTYRCQKNTQ